MSVMLMHLQLIFMNHLRLVTEQLYKQHDLHHLQMISCLDIPIHNACLMHQCHTWSSLPKNFYHCTLAYSGISTFHDQPNSFVSDDSAPSSATQI